MKVRITLFFFLLLTSFLLIGCGKKKVDPNELTVLNYGKYIDNSVIKKFEQETGIKIKYEEYESPEEMYAKYKAGSIDYDLICSSDYMIQKLIKENEVLPIDYTNIPLIRNIDSKILNYAQSYDKGNAYSMPYFYGTVGILYNKTKVSEKDIGSWDILFNKKYSGKIIMENSVRDTFVVALKKLGYSINTTNKKELDKALKLLIKQKPLVYSYLVDETGDEMAAGNASLALCYSGEAAYAESLNSNLAFYVPKEGSNMWVDAWFMPKTCEHKKNAELFMNFLCREDVAAKNFDYVYYATPNIAVYNSLDDQIKNDTTIFPTKETLDNCAIFSSMNEEMTNYYTELWEELKSY